MAVVSNELATDHASDEPDYIEHAIQIIEAHHNERTNGRPSVMTAPRLRKLFSALERGNFRETACAYARIGWTTFKTWMLEGEDDEDATTAYGVFRAAVEFAESIPEMAASDRIQAAGKANPRFYMADVIWLSRARRKHWSDQQHAQPQINVAVAFGVQGQPPAPPAITVSASAPALSPSLSEDLHRLSADKHSANVA